MLTKEQQAKVFGLYIGSKVLVKGEEFELAGIIWDNRHPELSILLYNVNKGYRESVYFKDGWPPIILTPLSEITDEDKIYLIKGCYNTHINYEDPSPLYEWKDEWLTWRMISAAADYLRSKSYHVPYLGMDLYECGLAITANSLTKNGKK